MWDLNQAQALHNEFHRMDEPKPYADAVDALTRLPIQARNDLESVQSKVWTFLRRWGRVQGLARVVSDEMVKRLNSYADLVTLLRQYNIDEDLSQKFSYESQMWPVAGWMQLLLNHISQVRRSEIVASTKLLHAAMPELFVMFDGPMCSKFFRTWPSDTVYCGLFLPLVQAEVEFLSGHGLRPDETKVCGKSWAKFVDEINWTWANT